MFKLNRKASAFSVAFAAVAAGSAGFAPSAFAQDDSIEEVVVTGSCDALKRDFIGSTGSD
jgi:O-acetyl-ADP-ribose deacetylase (regulator of RNase III)